VEYWVKFQIQEETMKLLRKRNKQGRCIHFFIDKQIMVRQTRANSRKWRKIIRKAIVRLNEKNMEVSKDTTNKTHIKWIAQEIMIMAMEYWERNHNMIRQREIIQELYAD
jgi:L-lactate utilization protein LutC